MCGRCACTRDPEGVRSGCIYKRKDAIIDKPAWISPNSQTYFPSYNIGPQTNTPVLISGAHPHAHASGECGNERVLQVMKWGLLPSWHRGQPRDFPSSLSNCRYDTMFDRSSFKPAINSKRRCVVLADGFYEWTKGKTKQAYYVYFTDQSPTQSSVEWAKENDMVKQEGACAADVSTKLLTMAGLFDIWHNDTTSDEPLFTYTVLTVDATDNFSKIHHRLPAILENDDAIRTWLDIEVPTFEAIKIINPRGSETLSWHPVSSLVNNVRNKSPSCIVKIDPDKASKKGTLHNWFPTKGTKTEDPPCKKPKFGEQN